MNIYIHIDRFIYERAYRGARDEKNCTGKASWEHKQDRHQWRKQSLLLMPTNGLVNERNIQLFKLAFLQITTSPPDAPEELEKAKSKSPLPHNL